MLHPKYNFSITKHNLQKTIIIFFFSFEIVQKLISFKFIKKSLKVHQNLKRSHCNFNITKYEFHTIINK